MSILEMEDSKSKEWFKSIIRRLFEAGYLEEV